LHERYPWEISKIAPDFDLLDVWALPVEGEREDFAGFLQTMASFDPVDTRFSLSRALIRVRLRLGALFGWDDPAKKRPIPGCTESTLSERLPDHLRGTADAPFISGVLRRAGGGFKALYRTKMEAAAEISNDTVHAVLHLGWVEQADGRYRAHLAIYVKPRGVAGRIYLKLIQPFRHFIVYPTLMRQIRGVWERRPGRTRS
jgi:hypothetical protein